MRASVLRLALVGALVVPSSAFHGGQALHGSALQLVSKSHARRPSGVFLHASPRRGRPAMMMQVAGVVETVQAQVMAVVWALLICVLRDAYVFSPILSCHQP